MTKIVSTIGASTVVHPVHGTFTAGADGSFEVSPELAAELLAFPHWTTEDSHMAEVERIDLAELHDPLFAAEALAGLREDAAVLKAGGTLEPADQTARWAPDARTLAWAGLHLRGDAAGIGDWSRLVIEIDTLQQRAALAAADAPVAAEKTAEVSK